MENITGALIALAASTITLVITQIFEYLKSRTTHNNELRKMYFEKKLNAAELMFSQLETLRSSFLHLTIVYDRQIDKDPLEPDDEGQEMVDKNLFETAKKYLDLAQDSVYKIANAAALYFDLDEPAKDKLKLLHDDLALITKKQKLLFDADDQLRKALRFNGDVKKAQSIFEENKLAFKNHLVGISEMCDELYKMLGRQSEIIRSEMRKYE